MFLSGFSNSTVVDYINSLEGHKSVKGLLLTHTHFDHMYGINKLIDQYHECIVYTSDHGKEGLYSDKLNNSRYHGKIIIFKGENVNIVKEGDQVQLFENVFAHVFETPGHDWSCVSYKIGEWLFSGDSFIPGVPVRAIFKKSNKEQAKESEERIQKELMKDVSVVYAGHCNPLFLN